MLKAPPTPATVRITMRSNPSQNRTKLLQQCSCAFLLFPVAYVWSAPWPNLLAVHVWDCFQRRHSSGALATHRPSVTSLRPPEDTPGLSRHCPGVHSHNFIHRRDSQGVQAAEPVVTPSFVYILFNFEQRMCCYCFNHDYGIALGGLLLPT